MDKQEKKITPEQEEIEKRHTTLVNKIDTFIKENKDLNFGTNSKKVDSFSLLVKQYNKSLSKKATIDRNQREWNRDDKAVENFKKYRIRISENSICQLTNFYNFLLSFKGDIVVPSKKIPKERHPLGSETLVDFLRKKSAEIVIPSD